MITLLLLILSSISIVFAAERNSTTRGAMQKLVCAYSPGTCRSFILDILILLPLVGLLAELLSRRIKNYRNTRFFAAISTFSLFLLGIVLSNFILALMGLASVSVICFPSKNRLENEWTIRQLLYITAIIFFLAISSSLYFNHFNFYFLTPLLGHPEAWGGNHFMWNSGIEVLGLKPIVDTTIPTYQNFWGFWNMLALALLGPVYIWVMVEPRTWILLRAWTRLHGLLFGYTKKQTGISALFFEPHTK